MKLLGVLRNWVLAGLVLVPAAYAQDVVRIGAVLPVTGKESKIGSAYKQATELAVKEVNDAGGLLVAGKKLKIDLSLLDDTSDAAKSAQLVEQRLAQSGAMDGLQILFGNDHVGVDIDHVQGGGDALKFVEWFHGAGTIAKSAKK